MNTTTFLLGTSFAVLGDICFSVAVLSLTLFFLFDDNEFLEYWYITGGTGIVCVLLDAVVRAFS